MKKTIALCAVLVAAVIATGINQSRRVTARLRQAQARIETQPDPIGQAVQPSTNQVAPVVAKQSPPPTGAAATNAAATGGFRSSKYYAFLTNKTWRLTSKQVEPYLNANRRNAESLLAAFRTTGDSALLAEAVKQYPDNPQVHFEAAIRMDASPEERRKALDALQKAAPENALPDYLSALAHFKAGQPEQAMQDLVAASGKTQVDDYFRERVQADEEAYLAGGYSAGEAKMTANAFLTFPQLAQVGELGRNLVDLANSYQKAGDDASRQAALQMAIDLGRRYQDPSVGQRMISQLAGVNVERAALGAMDPNSPYGENGQTVQNRLDQLAQQKQSFRDLAKQADPFWQAMSDQDWVSYHSRSSFFGEESAVRWLVGKYSAR